MRGSLRWLLGLVVACKREPVASPGAGTQEHPPAVAESAVPAESAPAEVARRLLSVSERESETTRQESPDDTHCLILEVRSKRRASVVAWLARHGMKAGEGGPAIELVATNRQIHDIFHGRVTVQCGSAAWSNTGTHAVCIPTLEGARVPSDLASDVTAIGDGYKICE